MKKVGFCLFMMFGGLLYSDGANIQNKSEFSEEGEFTLTVTQSQAKVIEELVETMANTSVFTLLFKKGYLQDLAKQLRPVSSTQFLGYVFQQPHLIHGMKSILKSKTKWDNLTRSIVRGLKKESATTLFDDIPSFAQFTNGDAEVLTILAEREDWNSFIVHLIEQN
jgi:hypothetical protein